ILSKEEALIGLTRLFWTGRDKLLERSAILADCWNDRRQGFVPFELKFRNRELAAGASRIAGDEYQIAFFRTVFAPVQVLGCRDGLATFVDAHQAEIEIEAREIEIIWIAAKKAGVELGREHQANIIKAAVMVQVVNSTVIKGDEVTSDLRVRSAALLKFGALGVQGGVCRFSGLAGERTVHVGSAALYVGQLVELELRAFLFLSGGVGDEPAVDQVQLRRR